MVSGFLMVYQSGCYLFTPGHFAKKLQWRCPGHVPIIWTVRFVISVLNWEEHSAHTFGLSKIKKSNSVTPTSKDFRHRNRISLKGGNRGKKITTEIWIICQVKAPEKCSVTQMRSSLLLADSLIQVPNVSLTFNTCIGFPIDVIMDSIKRRESYSPPSYDCNLQIGSCHWDLPTYLYKD